MTALISSSLYPAPSVRKRIKRFCRVPLTEVYFPRLICLEHQLSVIEIKPYRERQKRTLYPPRESNRDKLCAVIDNILLNERPANFEGFLQKLEQQGYEIKRGKYTSVKGTRQKRFIRFRTADVPDKSNRSTAARPARIIKNPEIFGCCPAQWSCR